MPRTSTHTPKTTRLPKVRAKKAEIKAPLKAKELKVEPKAELKAKPAAGPVKRTYLFAVGKRKTAVARVRLHFKSDKAGIEINSKTYQEYFPYFESQQLVEQPLKKLNLLGKYFISIKVSGSGKHAQAEAIRHGIARVLLKLNESWRKTLRGEGLLTRDSRKKERKKPGLKRARRAPQWQKR